MFHELFLYPILSASVLILLFIATAFWVGLSLHLLNWFDMSTLIHELSHLMFLNFEVIIDLHIIRNNSSRTHIPHSSCSEIIITGKTTVYYHNQTLFLWGFILILLSKYKPLPCRQTDDRFSDLSSWMVSYLTVQTFSSHYFLAK